MTLIHILVFSVSALLAGWLMPTRLRGAFLLSGSLIALYWLQPSTPIRNLDFWLPTTSILLTILVWAWTCAARAHPPLSEWGPSALLILVPILVIAFTRYTGTFCCLTPTRPPDISIVLLMLAGGFILAYLPLHITPLLRRLPVIAFILIISLFLVLKMPQLSQATSAALRNANGQDATLASALDLPWLGFSYLAFRLLHVLRDYQGEKLPAYGLGDFVTYALFFPAVTAGPIDRSQHFQRELTEANKAVTGASSAQRIPAPNWSQVLPGAERILWGVFKKFVLADSLALIALSPQNALQVQTPLWTWVLLYAYALRLYFDFSGYTDVALGLARLLGINLPENFDRPYLKENLTSFWNSWHITLAQWFRAYFFFPLTRALRSRPQKLPVWTIIFTGQMGTMLLIGLWHGVSWNFIAWGAWHGAGLFVHNRWSDWSRSRLVPPDGRPRLRALFGLGGGLLTFHYVVLGWVWFALPQINLSLHIFYKLFGLA
ncbi:MAG: MBOAT family O-acyltransferase [Anaerolineales bacterium]|jgi:alginate O-acetyltransferase complex protein AlgI